MQKRELAIKRLGQELFKQLQQQQGGGQLSSSSNPGSLKRPAADLADAADANVLPPAKSRRTTAAAAADDDSAGDTSVTPGYTKQHWVQCGCCGKVRHLGCLPLSQRKQHQGQWLAPTGVWMCSEVCKGVSMQLARQCAQGLVQVDELAEGTPVSWQLICPAAVAMGVAGDGEEGQQQLGQKEEQQQKSEGHDQQQQVAEAGADTEEAAAGGERHAPAAAPADCAVICSLGHVPGYTAAQAQVLGQVLRDVQVLFRQQLGRVVDVRTRQDVLPWLLSGLMLEGVWGTKEAAAAGAGGGDSSASGSGEMDLSNMHVAVLWVGSSLVAAALVRVFGKGVMEVPLMATLGGLHGKQLGGLLGKCLEGFAAGMKVGHWVMPLMLSPPPAAAAVGGTAAETAAAGEAGSYSSSASAAAAGGGGGMAGGVYQVSVVPPLEGSADLRRGLEGWQAQVGLLGLQSMGLTPTPPAAAAAGAGCHGQVKEQSGKQPEGAAKQPAGGGVAAAAAAAAKLPWALQVGLHPFTAADEALLPQYPLLRFHYVAHAVKKLVKGNLMPGVKLPGANKPPQQQQQGLAGGRGGGWERAAAGVMGIMPAGHPGAGVGAGVGRGQPRGVFSGGFSGGGVGALDSSWQLAPINGLGGGYGGGGFMPLGGQVGRVELGWHQQQQWQAGGWGGQQQQRQPFAGVLQQPGRFQGGVVGMDLGGSGNGGQAGFNTGYLQQQQQYQQYHQLQQQQQQRPLQPLQQPRTFEGQQQQLAMPTGQMSGGKGTQQVWNGGAAGGYSHTPHQQLQQGQVQRGMAPPGMQQQVGGFEPVYVQSMNGMAAAAGGGEQQAGGLSLKMMQQAALASAQRQQLGHSAEDFLPQ